MGIKGSLLISLVIHASILLVVLSFLPSPKKEVDFVRIDLSSVKIEKVSRQAPIKRVKKIRKRAFPKKRKPRKVAVNKKTIEKEPKNILTAPQERETKNPLGEEIPPKESPKREKVAKAPPVEPVPKTPESAPRDLDNAASLQKEDRHMEEEENYQERYREENLSVVREAIISYLSYPPIARRMGWEGTVIVRFTLLPNGSLAECGIEKGSGHKVLDMSALRAVELAHKNFPRPKKSVTLLVPIVYKLE